MKVYVRNKLVSLGGASVVLNENKEPIFKVKGKIFSFTRKKKIYDKDGKLMFIVRNKWFNWFVHKAFIYDSNKDKIAKVKDKYFDIKGVYYVEGYKDEIKIDGKFFSLTSEILKNGEHMAAIRREITWVADCFELEAEEEDVPFLVALTIAIDNIADKKHN